MSILTGDKYNCEVTVWQNNFSDCEDINAIESALRAPESLGLCACVLVDTEPGTEFLRYRYSCIGLDDLEDAVLRASQMFPDVHIFVEAEGLEWREAVLWKNGEVIRCEDSTPSPAGTAEEMFVRRCRS